MKELANFKKMIYKNRKEFLTLHARMIDSEANPVRVAIQGGKIINV